MDLLAEIRKLGEVRGEISVENRRSVETPLPYFQSAFEHVTSAVNGAGRQHSLSYAELLETAREVDSQEVARFVELDEEVDSDVFGRWFSGDLTETELLLFQKLVDNWRESADALVNCISPADEANIRNGDGESPGGREG